MRYYFPGAIKSKNDYINSIAIDEFTVSCGEHAIQIILQSTNLRPGVKVAIPAFVCHSVKRAVTNAGCVPYYLDLKSDGTFHSAYVPEKLKEANVAVVVLVHLYGYLHPDTKMVEEYCLLNNILLIHDLAQSYGLDENQFHDNFPKVYSFGPGKSTTAAGGAIIRWRSNQLINVKLPSANIVQDIRAHFFVNSRLYGYQRNSIELFIEKVMDKFIGHRNPITQMSTFQKKLAGYMISNFEAITAEREKRWEIIDMACRQNKYIKNPLPQVPSLGFKYVISAFGHEQSFQQYLMKEQIPFYCIGNDIFDVTAENIPYFKQYAKSFFEISCEQSIPLDEIKRIADKLLNFKP